MQPSRLLLSALLCSFLTPSALAQEDAYHEWLRDHLAEAYGLEGGDWVFGDTEHEVLALGGVTSGVSVGDFSVSRMPFTRGRRFTITQPSASSWHRATHFHIPEPIGAGDALLVVMWLRHTWPDDNVGIVEPLFEEASSPYAKSLERAFSVPRDWGLYLIPFESLANYASSGARYQLNMGRQRQMVELGGLALVNYGSTYSADELPEVIPAQVAYGGHEPDAAWREAARERIETHRKGAFRIAVTDGAGNPVPGAAVSVSMKSHAFGFGTAVNTGIMIGGGALPAYRDRLEDVTGDGRTFNMAVLENALKWRPWESDWPVSKAQKVTAVAWLVSRGMDVRGHNLVWPTWEHLPDDIQANQNNPEHIRTRIRNHILALAGYRGLKGVLRDWDVVNEPAHLFDLRDVFHGNAGYSTGEEIYAEWFEWAHEADPGARLYINDYSIVSSFDERPQARSEYKRIIRELIETGAPLHGLGVQGHMGEPLTPIDTVYRVIDELAAFGTEISVTEYDAARVNEEVAGDYMRDFLTVVFSHPSVRSFLMWGFWDGSHWLDDAPLFREDWSLKPSGEAFLDLVFDEWWTEEDGLADTSGLWQGRGFAGTYDVSAAIDGTVVTREVELSGGDTLEVELSLASTSASPADVEMPFAVEPNFPNPVVDFTTIEYMLPAAARVSLEVYDLLGRRVLSLEQGLQGAGRRSLVMDASHLPSGVYLYRLGAGEHRHTGRMSVIH